MVSLMRFTPLLGALFAIGLGPEALAASVTVDGATEYQTVEGGGLMDSKNAYPIPLDDLARQVRGLGFSSYMSRDQMFEVVNDDGDPLHLNWDTGASAFNVQFAQADVRLQVARAYQDAGLAVTFGNDTLPAWMEVPVGSHNEFAAGTPGMYDELAEYWTAYLQYAKNQHGLDIAEISLLEEPDCNPGTWMTADEMRVAIKTVGARLAGAGLSTRITAPATAIIATARSYLQTILADAAATGYLTRLSYHAYDYNNGSSAMHDFAVDPMVQASGLSIWMSEWTLQRTPEYPKRSEAYKLSQNLPWALDWGKFFHTCFVEGQCSLVTPSRGDGLEYAPDVGMFGPGLGGGGLRLKKFGHVITQYVRFIQQGSKRIDVSSPGVANLYVSAFHHPTSGALAIVMLNTGTSPVSLTLNLSNLAVPAHMRAVRTSATEDSAELGPVTPTGSSFTVALPAQSITTYSGTTLADTVPPTVPTGLAATALSDCLVRIAWTPSTDAVGVAGYRLFRDGTEIGLSGATSYVDNNLRGQTAYTYTVSAFDLAGNESAQSQAASVTTLADTVPPLVPAHVVATPQPTGVTITWDPSIDSVADHDLTGFRVYSTDTSGGPCAQLADLPGATVAGYTDTTVGAGQTRYYVVTSYDAETPANESAFSNEAAGTPLPRLPGGLAASYYDATNASVWEWFGTLKASRVDPTVDFNWEQVQPPAGRYITGAYGTTYHWCLFGSRWQGEVLSDASENVTFGLQNLDGARLWVDGVLLINDWDGWFTHTPSATVSLTAGWHEIRLDYYRYHPEAGEDGVIRLYHSSPTVANEIIPSDHLATVSATCPGCLVGGNCFNNGTQNPANECQLCDTSQSTTAWSNRNDGTACDDGDPCTTPDTCNTAGQCIPGPNTCADAGVDAGIDAGVDGGMDAGVDGGVDEGVDGGVDAGVDGSGQGDGSVKLSGSCGCLANGGGGPGTALFWLLALGLWRWRGSRRR